jgi:hypothetical protein
MAGGDPKAVLLPVGPEKEKEKEGNLRPGSLIKPHRQQSLVHTSKVPGRHSLKIENMKNLEKVRHLLFSLPLLLT